MSLCLKGTSQYVQDTELLDTSLRWGIFVEIYHLFPGMHVFYQDIKDICHFLIIRSNPYEFIDMMDNVVIYKKVGLSIILYTRL